MPSTVNTLFPAVEAVQVLTALVCTAVSAWTHRRTWRKYRRLRRSVKDGPLVRFRWKHVRTDSVLLFVQLTFLLIGVLRLAHDMPGLPRNTALEVLAVNRAVVGVLLAWMQWAGRRDESAIIDAWQNESKQDESA